MRHNNGKFGNITLLITAVRKGLKLFCTYPVTQNGKKRDFIILIRLIGIKRKLLRAHRICGYGKKRNLIRTVNLIIALRPHCLIYRSKHGGKSQKILFFVAFLHILRYTVFFHVINPPDKRHLDLHAAIAGVYLVKQRSDCRICLLMCLTHLLRLLREIDSPLRIVRKRDFLLIRRVWIFSQVLHNVACARALCQHNHKRLFIICALHKGILARLILLLIFLFPPPTVGQFNLSCGF